MDGKNEVIANGKTSHKMTCAFCSDNHPYTSCPKQEEYKLISMEYILSVEKQVTKISTRQRLVSMPIIPLSTNRSSFLDGVSKQNHSVNFIIQDCHELNYNSSNETVEGRGYCVSFLASDGSVDANGRIFICGSVMNELVCHNKVKKTCLL